MIVLLGYFTATNSKALITVTRKHVYDSRSNVASVATGSFFPIVFENLDEQEFTLIVTMTRMMMYTGNSS